MEAHIQRISIHTPGSVRLSFLEDDHGVVAALNEPKSIRIFSTLRSMVEENVDVVENMFHLAWSSKNFENATVVIFCFVYVLELFKMPSFGEV